MARDMYVDTLIEFSTDGIDLNKSGQILLDKLRPKAEELVAEIPGAQLRTDRQVELHVGHGEHKLTQEPMYLVSARWPVTVPDWATV
jgi:hypothetical protein